MGAPRLIFAIAILTAILLLPAPAFAQTPQKPDVSPPPDIALTLRLDRVPAAPRPQPRESLAERSLPAILFSPSQWREAFNEFGAEAKPALWSYYWTGRPMVVERNNLYYSRSPIGYYKGIIFAHLAHNRLDLGIYKGRVTLEQNRVYGMGPRPISNALPFSNTRFFRSPVFADVDKVYVMVRFHVTLPKR